MKIKFKWLAAKDLKPEKISADLPPMYNVVGQFGFDMHNPKIVRLFKAEIKDGPPWYGRLGWDGGCEELFWGMLIDAYQKDKKAVLGWHPDGWAALAHYARQKKGTLPMDYLLNGPTTSKDSWEANKKKYNGD